MKKQIKVPFDKNTGNQLTYYYQTFKGIDVETDESIYGVHDYIELRDNYEFEASLLYQGYERGRSALNIIWKDINREILYYSGIKMLDEILKGREDISAFLGKELLIQGRFTFKKQGTSYLLTYVK